MVRNRHPSPLICLSALLIAGLLVTGCGSSSMGSSGTATAAGVPNPPTASSLVLAGTPATSVMAGQNYTFQPTVTSTAAVTFQIQGKPSWATFNPSTGALTGMPAAANEGTTGAITITGSNGSSSASIGPFTIEVNAPPVAGATGSATLSWTVPTENTDGSPVVNLEGYHIYYGTTEGAWTSTIVISSPTETSYVVSGLAPGTYYFAIVAFNSEGEVSPQSNVASKTI
jgi:Fibronectin type III domain